SHTSRRVAPHVLFEQIGHVLLDDVPHTPLEVDVARRDSVRTDALRRFLPRDALGEVDERRLQRTIGWCHMCLGCKGRGYDHDGSIARLLGGLLEKWRGHFD